MFPLMLFVHVLAKMSYFSYHHFAFFIFPVLGCEPIEIVFSSLIFEFSLFLPRDKAIDQNIYRSQYRKKNKRKVCIVCRPLFCMN